MLQTEEPAALAELLLQISYAVTDRVRRGHTKGGVHSLLLRGWSRLAALKGLSSWCSTGRRWDINTTIPFTPLKEDHSAPTASTFALGPQAPIHAHNRALKVWAFSRSWKRRNTFSSWRGIGAYRGWRMTTDKHIHHSWSLLLENNTASQKYL